MRKEALWRNLALSDDRTNTSLAALSAIDDVVKLYVFITVYCLYFYLFIMLPYFQGEIKVFISNVSFSITHTISTRPVGGVVLSPVHTSNNVEATLSNVTMSNAASQ